MGVFEGLNVDEILILFVFVLLFVLCVYFLVLNKVCVFFEGGREKRGIG